MRYRQGFTLPVVLIISLSAFIVGLAAFQVISATFLDNIERRNLRLAQEAGEAGVSYAQACLKKSDNTVTWTNKTLRPNTDCNGDIVGSQSPYVLPPLSGSNVRTTFEIIDSTALSEHDVAVADYSATISARGTTEIVASDGTTVLRTYRSVIRKTVVTHPDLAPKQSTSGTQRTCGLLGNSVWCWGLNGEGQLGNGTTDPSPVPVEVVRQSHGDTGIGTHAVTVISSAGYINCMIIETNEVYCWGSNDKGQLGQGTASPGDYSSIPLRVNALHAALDPGDRVAEIALTNNTPCARTEQGNLYCWGANSLGQVGNNSAAAVVTSPVKIAGQTGGYGDLANKKVAKLISSGGSATHMCAIDEAEALYCWGNNANGQVGNNSAVNSIIEPTLINGGALSGKRVIEVAVDGSGGPPRAKTCAIAYTISPDDAQVYCWGSDFNLMISAISPSPCPPPLYCHSPIAVNATPSSPLYGKTVTDLGVGIWGACVLAHPTGSLDPEADTGIYCWGYHTTVGGGPGYTTYTNEFAYVTVPTAVDLTMFNGHPVNSLTGGIGRMCIHSAGRVYCWGNNDNGQIGDGTQEGPRFKPTEALYLRPRDIQYIY